ncbi:MAG: DNA alkylation repair protein [Candidatus Eisenbacteria bacterium]
MQLERTLGFDDPEALIATMAAVQRQRPTAEAGAFQTCVIRRLRGDADTGDCRRKIWVWTRLCSSRPEAEARQVACALLDTFWKDHRKEVEKLTLNLARDEEYEVRLYAASTMARIIRSNFRAYFRHMRAWSRHADPSVRRQVIIATVAVADADRPEWARPLLDLLEPHMSDRDPYIRRNLGPFALGQGMLRVYPEETLERCEKWLEAPDEIVRWNIAMAFATPVIPVDRERTLAILKTLASDQRRFVWGAAGAALRNLVKAEPKQLLPVLKQWQEEPDLRVAVSTAFSRSVR